MRCFKQVPLGRGAIALAACLVIALALSLSAAAPDLSAAQPAGKKSAKNGHLSGKQGKRRSAGQRVRRRALRRHARRKRAHPRQRAGKRRRVRLARARVAVARNAPAAATRPGVADVLDAGFERGLENWNTAGVGEIVPAVVGDIVRSGSRSSAVMLSASQDRSELILGGNGGGSTTGMVEFHEGEERFYGFSIFVASMVYGRPGAHNLFMQFKSEGEGSPAFGLQLWDYEGDNGDGGGKGLWSSGEAMGGDRFLAPLAEHVWHDVVIHFRASRTGAGFYEVYVDGTLVDSRTGVSMIRPDRSYAYIKNGLYRNGSRIPGNSEIRIDAARLGASWSDIAS